MKNSRLLITSAAMLLASAAATTAVFADTREQLDQWIEDNADERKYTPEEAMAELPPGPNPFLSFRPEGEKVNESYWSARRTAAAAANAGSNAPANVRLQFNKNNGTHLKGFGTGPSRDDAVDLTGSIDLPAPTVLIANPEDECSIPLATPTNLLSGTAVSVSGTIGDGLFGSTGTGSGDVDFYQIPTVAAGQLIIIDVDTPIPFGDLDSFVALWDEAGNLIAFNDDDGSSFDSRLIITAPADGNYYAAITGFGTFITGNPFDSSSGFGAGSEGSYDATISLEYFGVAEVSFNLQKRDIFGASINGASLSVISLIDKQGVERQGSAQDATGIHPLASPLPGGNAALSHTVDTTGEFTLQALVVGADEFTLSLRAFINPLVDASRGEVQTIFIDFDGAEVDTGEIFFGIPPGIFVSNLSPLVDFLPGWGLTAADEDDVIDAIMAHVRESLVTDVDMLGREPTFDIELLNSRDDADPGNADNVSRIIVGGSIAEFGIGTLGIAQSIDVGNFETSETAVVLLDLLSAPATNPNSLNQYPLASGVSIVELIGAGVGNITAHEAGHFLGNWHTDQFNDSPNIQDQGGNLANTVGVGADGIFGTDDDADVDFGRDDFVPSEGFTGVEDTLNTIAIGNPTPRGN